MAISDVPLSPRKSKNGPSRTPPWLAGRRGSPFAPVVRPGLSVQWVPMPHPAGHALAAARQSLARRVEFGDFLARLSARERLNAEKRVVVLEAEAGPGRATLWRRLVCALATLAPHAAKLVGRQTVQFYVADGKYRMQVFALEDNRDGKLLVYAVDAMDDAIKAQVIKPTPKGAEDAAAHPISNGQALSVESLTNENTPNPSAFYKHMLGWNRKAVRITLPHDATGAQVEAAEQLCAIAAIRWAPKETG